MAARLPTQDILGVFRAIKDDVQTTVLRPRGLSLKSAGTKGLALSEPLSATKGFWEDPRGLSNKPKRWIPQVEMKARGGGVARFALDPTGNPIGMGQTIGYVNNRDGSCVVCAFRVVPAVRAAGSGGAWSFPDGWEYLLVVAFDKPLPAGTSGDPLSAFDPVAGTVDYGAGAARATYRLAFRAIVKAPVASSATAMAGTTFNYSDVGDAVADFVGASVYDGERASERDRLVADLAALFAPAAPQARFAIAEDTTLIGIDPSVYRQIDAAVNSGKRHIILYGPPGTGKTTLAEHLAREVSERDNDGSYLMLTASSAWNQQDLVGGYQPLGNGAIGFIPGALLRNFDRPVIIDELNRCPIDKVLGPMFSILSGQSSTLPCRVDAADPASPFHIVYPEPYSGMRAHEHAPKPAWRLICTLNMYDKTQLGQISYALSRRFAWIKVGAPTDPDEFVSEMARSLGVTVPAPIPLNTVGEMWKAVNAVREIGGAPIVDFIKTIRALDPAANLFAPPAGSTVAPFLSAFSMCVLPLMDGLSPREARDLADDIKAKWGLDAARSERLRIDCEEFSA